MTQTNLEIGNARISVENGNNDSAWGEETARRMFALLGELIERERLHVATDTVVARLDVPPIALAPGADDKESAARAGAEAIYRELVRTLT